MKQTLSDNRLILNIKGLAPAGLSYPAIEDGHLGIIDVTTDKTVAPASFDELPAKFRLVHKFNGRMTYGFDCIEKKNLVWSRAQEHKPEVLNKWEGVIEHCNCIDSVKLSIFMQNDVLNRAVGMPWGTNDSFLEVAPQEMECYCSCNEAGTYANNVMTMLFYKKALFANSPFYTITVETADGGQKFTSLKEVEDFVKANKEINVNKDSGDDGQKLKLVIEAKPLSQPTAFNPYNRSVHYPTGSSLLPAFEINGRTGIPFTEVTEAQYEIGHGLHLLEEEHDNKSYFSVIGSYPRTRDLVVFPEYQFEASKKYDTLTFEWDSPKMKRAGEADKKRFLAVFGSEVGVRTEVHDKLKEIFKLP